MDATQQTLSLLPAALRQVLCPAADGAEQLHLRLGQSPCVLREGREWVVPGPAVTENDLRQVLERASCGSFQSVESQCAQGFVSAPGGVRVGLCGTAVIREGRVTSLRDLSSVCIRIPRECRGCADGIFPQLTRPQFQSALVFSPPGAGKTTLLRELIRKLSDTGLTVAVADERGELAGMAEGRTGFDLGGHTDVMSAMPKSAAAQMLIRSMAPQVLAMDEIGGREDVRALETAVGCGVALLASVHASEKEDVLCKPLLRPLLRQGVFHRLVGIRSENGVRHYEVTEL